MLGVNMYHFDPYEVCSVRAGIFEYPAVILEQEGCPFKIGCFNVSTMLKQNFSLMQTKTCIFWLGTKLSILNNVDESHSPGVFPKVCSVHQALSGGMSGVGLHFSK